MKDGLWIPSKILKLDSIDFLSKGILSEIESLSKLEKGCYVSNKTLSDLFDVSVRTIINKINQLEKLGFIKITYKTTSKNVTLRTIKMTEKITSGVVKKFHGGSEKNDKGVVKKFHPTSISLSKEREIYNKNTQNQKTKKFSDLENKKVIKYNFVEGNILRYIENKVGDIKIANMVFANMNEDFDIKTKDDFKYLLENLDKQELIDTYGSFRI